ncbi:hypothetical protein RHA1_ro05672 [Rhodococcus jostii RHA1]|uniref:Uncharacterized protein n=1 Tax=Rhodococcus jostii (strain RHA1) TaxID=101510 RepID=Q0S4T5_RHOJR|nr:hypothetical protein RHA1_ro05672 [Rhodococcus jostii RHA1]
MTIPVEDVQTLATIDLRAWETQTQNLRPPIVNHTSGRLSPPGRTRAGQGMKLAYTPGATGATIPSGAHCQPRVGIPADERRPRSSRNRPRLTLHRRKRRDADDRGIPPCEYLSTSRG